MPAEEEESICFVDEADHGRVARDLSVVESLLKTSATCDDNIMEVVQILKKLGNDQKELRDGQKELRGGQKELQDGRKKLQDGQKELHEGHKELLDGQTCHRSSMTYTLTQFNQKLSRLNNLVDELHWKNWKESQEETQQRVFAHLEDIHTRLQELKDRYDHALTTLASDEEQGPCTNHARVAENAIHNMKKQYKKQKRLAQGANSRLASCMVELQEEKKKNVALQRKNKDLKRHNKKLGYQVKKLKSQIHRMTNHVEKALRYGSTSSEDESQNDSSNLLSSRLGRRRKSSNRCGNSQRGKILPDSLERVLSQSQAQLALDFEHHTDLAITQSARDCTYPNVASIPTQEQAPWLIGNDDRSIDSREQRRRPQAGCFVKHDSDDEGDGDRKMPANENRKPPPSFDCANRKQGSMTNERLAF